MLPIFRYIADNPLFKKSAWSLGRFSAFAQSHGYRKKIPLTGPFPHGGQTFRVTAHRNLVHNVLGHYVLSVLLTSGPEMTFHTVPSAFLQSKVNKREWMAVKSFLMSYYFQYRGVFFDSYICCKSSIWLLRCLIRSLSCKKITDDQGFVRCLSIRCSIKLKGSTVSKWKSPQYHRSVGF